MPIFGEIPRPRPPHIKGCQLPLLVELTQINTCYTCPTDIQLRCQVFHHEILTITPEALAEELTIRLEKPPQYRN